MLPEHAFVKSSDIVETNLWMNWPIICVDRVEDIPADYPGAMGVPITYMSKHNPERFEILDMTKHQKLASGREPYKRIVIRNLHPDLPEDVDLVACFAAMGIPIDFEFVSQLPEDAMEIRRRRSDG